MISVYDYWAIGSSWESLSVAGHVRQNLSATGRNFVIVTGNFCQILLYIQ